MFHRSLLQYNEEHLQDKLSTLKFALGKVVAFKKKRSEIRLRSLLKDNKLIDREYHFLRLLFGRECFFHNPQIEELENSSGNTYDYSRAFIEKTIAHVVNTNNSQLFEIVDPIAAVTFSEQAFKTFIADMWKFMANEFVGDGNDFELFIIMLLLHESKKLNGQPINKSPLFKDVPDTLNDWTLNTKSFFNDRNLKKKILQDNYNIPGLWLSQLANNYFQDSFIRPDLEKGPDGMFYLKHCQENKHQLVTCAITLVSDPITDMNQPDKAINLMRTLSLEKSGKINNLDYSIPNSLAKY